MTIYLVGQRLFEPCSVARVPESVLLYAVYEHLHFFKYLLNLVHTHIYMCTYIYIYIYLV